MPIYYRDGYKGQLAVKASFQVPTNLWPRHLIDTEFLTLDAGGKLTIKSGYAWDFASGPTLDSKWMPGYKKARKPSLVHDAFCQLIRNGHMYDVPEARKYADRYFYKLLIENKMWKIRAKYWYRGVRIGALKEQKPKPILEAP